MQYIQLTDHTEIFLLAISGLLLMLWYRFYRKQSVRLDSFLHAVSSRVVQNDRVVIGIFFLLVIVSKISFLTLPLFWDEQLYFERVTNAFAHGIGGWFPRGVHYPGILVPVYWFFSKLIPHQLVAFRMVTLVFSALCLVFTYKIGTFYFGKKAAFASSILLLVYPFYFAQSGLFLYDIPVAAVCAGMYYCYIRGWIVRGMILACCVLAIKATAIVFLEAFFVFIVLRIIFSHEKAEKREQLRLLSIPGVVFLALGLGFLVWPYFRNNLLGVVDYFFGWRSVTWLDGARKLYHVFGIHGGYFLAVSILVGGLLRKQEVLSASFRERVSFLLFLFLLLAASVLSFILLPKPKTHPLYRYFLFIMPFYFSCGVGFLFLFLRKPLVRVAAMVFLCGVFIFSGAWYSKHYDSELSLDYMRLIDIHKQTARYLSHTMPHAVMYCSWPIREYLSHPAYGYVQAPLDARYVYRHDSLLHKDAVVVVMAHCLHYQDERDLVALARRSGMSAVAGFRLGVAETIIYAYDIPAGNH